VDGAHERDLGVSGLCRWMGPAISDLGVFGAV